MNDVNALLQIAQASFQGSQEESAISAILFNESVNLKLGDQRLNSVAALTYNTQQCDRIYNLLEKALNPQDYPWHTLNKSLLLLHTIVLYGSEIAIDKAIQLYRIIEKLHNYNSVTTTTSFLFISAGTDYGAPVRQASKELCNILISDTNIRAARSKARAGQDSLVPLGELIQETKSSNAPTTFYGQVLEKSVGAGYGMDAIPGMYEGRPERYFDRSDDKRQTKPTGDHQFTREAFAPDLLDLDFNHEGNGSTTSDLPEAQYLPALEKQKELERKLAEQQEQLQKLMAMTVASSAGNVNSNYYPPININGTGSFPTPYSNSYPNNISNIIPQQQHQQQQQQQNYPQNMHLNNSSHSLSQDLLGFPNPLQSLTTTNTHFIQNNPSCPYPHSNNNMSDSNVNHYNNNIIYNTGQNNTMTYPSTTNIPNNVFLYADNKHLPAASAATTTSLLDMTTTMTQYPMNGSSSSTIPNFLSPNTASHNSPYPMSMTSSNQPMMPMTSANRPLENSVYQQQHQQQQKSSNLDAFQNLTYLPNISQINPNSVVNRSNSNNNYDNNLLGGLNSSANNNYNTGNSYPEYSARDIMTPSMQQQIQQPQQSFPYQNLLPQQQQSYQQSSLSSLPSPFSGISISSSSSLSQQSQQLQTQNYITPPTYQPLTNIAPKTNYDAAGRPEASMMPMGPPSYPPPPPPQGRPNNAPNDMMLMPSYPPPPPPPSAQRN